MFAWLAAGLLGCGCVAGESRERPRIVLFVVLDTLSGRHVSHLGYDRATTPQLDRLAADGVLFEQAITPASYTVASIPSLLTGRLPDRHGLTWYDRRLPESEFTLGELAARAGYRSLAVVAVQNGGPRYGNLQGFDEALEIYVGDGPPGARTFRHRGRTVHMPRAGEFLPVVDAALDDLDDRESLFLYLHVLEPHDPYDPPLADRQALLDDRFPGPVQEADGPRLHDIPREGSPESQVVEAVTHAYDANVRWVDRNLGRMLDGLRERDLYRDALVIVTADHGEAFWEHGVRSHGFRLYEEEIHVPLVVKFPGSQGRAGRRVRGMVSTLDLFPSLCEWLGVAPPSVPLDGRSLEGAILDPAREPAREAILLRARRDARRFGLRTADFKAILHLPPEEGGEPVCELYDLRADPHEQRDLSAEDPQRADRMRRQILERLDELGDVAPAVEGDLPVADRELLEALGYADAFDSEGGAAPGPPAERARDDDP